MKIIRGVLFLLVVAAGVFMIIYGEHDDSPGGQLLGVVLVLIGLWRIWKLTR